MSTLKINNRVLPALRIAVWLQCLAVVAQSVFAGGMLDSQSWGYPGHQLGANVVHVLGAIQLIIAILYWRPARGPGWPALASLAILLAGFVQSAIGGSSVLAVHVPLGVMLAILLSWMVIWTAVPSNRRTTEPAAP